MDEVESLKSLVSKLRQDVESCQNEREIAMVKMEQAAEHGLLLLQQKSQLQRDLQEANELNAKAMLENKELISELETKKYVHLCDISYVGLRGLPARISCELFLRFSVFRNELENALEAAHDKRRIQMLDSVCKEESLLQGNMLMEEEFTKNRKKVEDELVTAKQQSHNAKQEIERLTQVNQVIQVDLDRFETT